MAIWNLLLADTAMVMLIYSLKPSTGEFVVEELETPSRDWLI